MNGVGGQQGDGGLEIESVVVHASQAPIDGLDILTERERQVVACLARGNSTKEVGFALGIANATVRVLLARAASKLGVRSREALRCHPAVQPLRATPATDVEG
jgi:two-component system nitrate/nitrite response regulator NarL